MFKFVLRLFPLFLFGLYTQITMAKETDNQFDFPYVIANYTLTEDFLFKMEKIEKECKNTPPEPETSETKYYGGSIEKQITTISNRPKLMKILRKNNITPKEFVIGSMALQTTLIMLFNKPSPEDFKREGLSSLEKNSIFLSNLEFGKKHLYRMISVLKETCR
ncbi:hypothetical protein ME1_00344 [Bartonella vinsonii subsp. arupensis OK-94-513]|uniref:Uncharacterized protein n=2 Tax=Bartonella vinsonii subsp. arupensis TaxID=110578 RepID=J0R1Z9_BARVI|nr:hypothetical protein [Bartonella vinsonii]EJF89574.1 hypothetical protein ME1_00344 [Bartonella vinsonii subsp. arupensis OK-94-513]EJF98222.1 hypothetical protein MEI_00721 [Bartonella vinsonii subsp. arupensis Pm136co]